MTTDSQVTERPWHAISQSAALKAVSGSDTGLSTTDAQQRLANGTNQISGAKQESVLGELVESVTEPLQLLLLVVAFLSALWGELRDAIAIIVIILAVVSIETITELRARRALEGLRSLTAPRARVFRDGELVEIAAAAVVPGDVVAFEAGDVVPADSRLLEALGLAIDESALTGEPVAAPKSAEPVGVDAPLSLRSSMAYAGTAIVAGEGRGLVVATGGTSQLGQLGRLVSEQREPPTSLQRALAELARTVLIVAIGASVLVPAIGLLAGQPFRQMLLSGLTLAFATIPEELPILVTVLLALGGQRLARRGALLRRLRAAETLGAVTVVVTDKTGTLTQNRLQLDRIEGDERAVLQVGLACQSLRSAGTTVGEPLEMAVAEVARAQSVSFDAEAIVAFPFDPGRKRMSRVWKSPEGLLVAVKGAPEAVLPNCRMAEAERQGLMAQVDALANEGLRVLAFAQRAAPIAPENASDAERDLEFVGFAAFRDPLRPGVREAVAELDRAGVATIVVTGDHPKTAQAIAREAGLIGGELLIGGSALEMLTDQQLTDRLNDHTVVARATPADKLRIVRLLQERGQVVAVTGDGVNDAPALSAADVGIAMGKRGTDLARDAAALVLTDDAYPTVAAAIESGRNLGSQLRRAVAFYLGAKVALVAAMAVPLALGYKAPFAPSHIVLLELFMDLGASVAFVAEPVAPETMQRPPRDPAKRFLDSFALGAIFLTGLTLFVAVLAAFLLVRWQYGPDHASAAAVTTWLITHVGLAWILRSQPGLSLRNNFAFPVWGIMAVLVAALVGASGLGETLGLERLPPGAWPWIVGSGAVGLVLAIVGRQASRLSAGL